MLKSRAPSLTNSPSIAFISERIPSIEARISRRPVSSSAFFTASRKAPRFRSRSIFSVSSKSRSRLASLFAFSYSTCGTLLSEVSFSRRCTFASATLSGSEEGSSSRARSSAACKSALRLFQLPSCRFVRNGGEQIPFLHFLSDGAASGRDLVSEMDEPGVLRPHRHDKRRLDPDGAVNRGNRRAFGHLLHLDPRHHPDVERDEND